MRSRGRPESFPCCRMRTVLGVVLTMLLFCAPIIWPERATAQIAKAAITGHIADIAGGVLQGALVTVRPSGFSSVSDDQGQYSVTNLPAGKYTVTISYSGFASFTKSVQLNQGQTLSLDAVLRVAPSDQSISVHGDL